METIQPEVDQRVLDKARDHVKRMDLQLINGMKFLGKNFVDDFKEMFELMSSLKLNNEVIACGFPRSGNHWALEYVSMILAQAKTCGQIQMHDCFLELMGTDIHKKVATIPEPRLLSTHLQPSFLPKDILHKPIKIVYILRNPKDAIVSWYKLSASSKNHVFNGNLAEFFELQLTSEFPWGSWFDHVIAWDIFIKENPQVDVFVVLYERMKEEPVKVITELCQFLGKPITLAEDIAIATKFDNMKLATAEKQKIHNELIVKDGHSVAMVSGQVKAWKKILTVDQNERFDKFFDATLAGNSLADMVREYIK